MRKKLKKTVIVFTAVIMCLLSLMSTTLFASGAIVASAKDSKSITVTASSQEVHKGKTVQLTANVKGVKWSTSNSKIATVDSSGLVKGVSKGTAVITATKGKQSGKITIYVTRASQPILNLLSKHNVLSYKYSYKDDYFYVDSPNAWQRHFGFNRAYDKFAQVFLFMEYDYTRVHFEYKGKDWMIQLWKGQYGGTFYGGEVGVYLKDHSDKKENVLTTYKCADKSNWLKIQTNLYHDQKLDGNYVRELSTKNESTWWSTGFKQGHLWREEPANELRLTGTITLKDKEMTEAFVEGFKECGFKQVKKCDTLGIDTFYVDGCKVVYSWQEISAAENTVAAKIVGSSALIVGFFGIGAFVLLMLLALGALGLIVLIII